MKENSLKELEVAITNLNGVTAVYEELTTQGAYSDFVEKVGEWFATKFKGLSKIFGTNNERLEKFNVKDLTVQSKLLAKLDSDVKKILAEGDFSKLHKLEAPVVVGLNSNLVNCNVVLKKNNSLIEANLIPMLDMVDETISMIVSNEDFRKSLSSTDKHIRKNRSLSQDMIESINTIIDKNSTREKVAVNDLIDRLSDLPQIVNDYKHLGSSFNVKYINEVHSKIAVIEEKSRTLYEYMVDEDNTDITISKESLKELISAIDVSANLVTVAITVFYLNMQVSDTVISTVKLLRKNV